MDAPLIRLRGVSRRGRIVLVALALLATAVAIRVAGVSAHGDEDHGDKAQPNAAPTGLEAQVRRVERTVDTPGGTFVVRLAQFPVDPRSGESAQFAVVFLEHIEGGFGATDGLIPVDRASVEARIVHGSLNEFVSSAETQPGDFPGSFRIGAVLPSQGDDSIELAVRTSDNRQFVVGFPLTVAPAPLNLAFWIGLAILVVISVGAMFGLRYLARPGSSSAGPTTAGRLVAPVGAILALLVGSVGLAYLQPPRERRQFEQVPELARLAAAKPTTAGPTISIPKESQLLFGIRTLAVTERQIVAGVRVTGTVRARPEAQAVVAAPVPGRLSLDRGITIGASVEQGDPVGSVENILSASDQAQLEGQKIDLEARVLDQKALAANQRSIAQQERVRLEQARRELQRATALVEAGVVSRKRFEEAQADVAIAEQSVAAAQAQASAAEAQADVASASVPKVAASRSFSLRAPVSGIVTDVRVSAGQQVESGTEVLRILDLSSVLVEARVFEGDLEAIRGMSAATLTATGAPDIVYRIGEGAEGRLVSIGSSVDPQTRTVAVTFELRNPGSRLREGMFVDVTIDKSSEREVVAVPSQAVVRDQGETFVFVYDGGETFERRVVKLGAEGQDYHEVESGLKDGDRVAVDGIYQLRATKPAG